MVVLENFNFYNENNTFWDTPFKNVPDRNNNVKKLIFHCRRQVDEFGIQTPLSYATTRLFNENTRRKGIFRISNPQRWNLIKLIGKMQLS